MKNFMLRTMGLAGLGLATLMLAAMPAAAQTTILNVDVPFAFAAGDQFFAAGQYRVTIDTGRMVLLLDPRTENKLSVAHLAMGGQSRPESRKGGPSLYFTNYGGHYVLSGLWKQGTTDGLRVMTAKRLVEAAKKL